MTDPQPPKKIALVCSAGGHLAEVMSIAWAAPGHHDFFLCITNFESVRDIKFNDFPRIYYAPAFWRYQQPFGVAVSVLAALWTFVKIFRKERPDFIISTGAEIALPAFLINKLFFHKPALYVESLARTEAPSLTGRLCYRLASHIFVQWPAVLKNYGPKAEYHGRVI